MKPKLFFIGLFCACAPAFAAPLTESTFTEIVKDVNVVTATTKAAQPAAVNELVKAPDLVRTGPASRAELTAADQTITRVGANTVFSFEPTGRNLNLEKGNVLFHSPAGKGGGSIRSGGAAAAVLGTTLIVSSTGNGGFKVILLEGKGTVTLPNRKSATLKAGQMAFVLPGQTEFGPVLEINLGKLVGGSQLVHGFSNPLPSLHLIQAAIDNQNKKLKNGQLQDTGTTPENFIPSGGNGSDTIDNNTYQNLIIPELRFLKG
jgi:FecR-like protein